MSSSLKRLFHITDGIVIPLIIACAFSLLFIEGQPRGVALALFVIATGVMVQLWALMRDLRAHASATREAAVGEPDELIELATWNLERRMTARSRAPFYVYLAIGHQLRGDWDGALAALAHADAYPRLKPAWKMLAATARVGTLVEKGDAKGARTIYDRDVVALTRRLSGPGVQLLAREAEARVRFAEGDVAGAAPLFARMSNDIRLGPATRGLAHWYAARCAEHVGGPDAADVADRHYADAAKLAPKTFVAKRPATA